MNKYTLQSEIKFSSILTGGYGHLSSRGGGVSKPALKQRALGKPQLKIICDVSYAQ